MKPSNERKPSSAQIYYTHTHTHIHRHTYPHSQAQVQALIWCIYCMPCIHATLMTPSLSSPASGNCILLHENVRRTGELYVQQSIKLETLLSRTRDYQAAAKAWKLAVHTDLPLGPPDCAPRCQQAIGNCIVTPAGELKFRCQTIQSFICIFTFTHIHMSIQTYSYMWYVGWILARVYFGVLFYYNTKYVWAQT